MSLSKSVMSSVLSEESLKSNVLLAGKPLLIPRGERAEKKRVGAKGGVGLFVWVR